MAYEKQEFKDNETVLTAEHLDHIEDGIYTLSENMGEVQAITLETIDSGYQVSGAIKGSVGSTIAISSTAAYHYIITNIGAADYFSVETYQASSKTYQYYGFALDENDVILATYGENTTYVASKKSFVIDNLPANAVKIAVLVYSQGGASITIQPEIKKITMGKYVQALNDITSSASYKVNFLYDALGATSVTNKLDGIDTSGAVDGGCQGSVGSTLRITSTSAYKYLIVDVGDATGYSVTTTMSSSGAYVYYAFALDDNNTVLGVYGENKDLDAKNVSFEIEDIPNNATKMAFFYYAGLSYSAVSISPFQTIFYFTNLDGGASSGGGGGGDSMTLKAIKVQLDIKRPIIIDRNSSKKYLNVVHITDTHLEDDNQTGLVDILTANQLASEGWIDIVVHGGDIFNSYETGSTNGSQGITKAVALGRIDDCLSNLKDARCPVWICRGNHDVNGKYMAGYPDDTTIDNTQKISQTAFNLIAQRGLRGDIDGEYGCSFYKDFDNEKVRAICLDAYPTDLQSVATNKNTMQFLVSALTLAEGKRDYSVVIFAHAWGGSLSTYCDALIAAFKNGTTFESDSRYGVTADFSAQGAGSFIGVIGGHSHAESEDSESFGFWDIRTNTSYLKSESAIADNIYATVYTFDTDNHIIYKEKLGNYGTTAAYNWDTLTMV